MSLAITKISGHRNESAKTYWLTIQWCKQLYCVITHVLCAMRADEIITWPYLSATEDVCCVWKYSLLLFLGWKTGYFTYLRGYYVVTVDFEQQKQRVDSVLCIIMWKSIASWTLHDSLVCPSLVALVCTETCSWTNVTLPSTWKIRGL